MPSARLLPIAGEHDNTRKISLRVLLRMTAMDVCCGPPSLPIFPA